jgi:hypothetical protein
MDYYNKYLKYKNKYLELKKQMGGLGISPKKNQCERKEVCKFVLHHTSKLNKETQDKGKKTQWKEIDNFVKTACIENEQMEKVPEQNLTKEKLALYKENLKHIEYYADDLVNDKNILKPLSSCSQKK